MKWFIPSWNGDVRIVPHEDNLKSFLIVEKPTVDELNILELIKNNFVEKGWVSKENWPESFGKWKDKKVEIIATVAEVGPVVAGLIRPGKSVLTAITLKNKEIITCSSDHATLTEESNKILKSLEKESESKPEKKPEVATTVKRPTPCCPKCQVGAIGPASEVLLSFLSPVEHESWAKNRSMIIMGGLSGHRYIVSHRNSKMAAKFGRICYDLDSGGVLHFHDWSVPPEEEVLATKLILEHRENWLRNEATCFALHEQDSVFKNPFGDVRDGTESTGLTKTLGLLFMALDKNKE